MSPLKYDPEENIWYESEGWRSWGCVTTLVEYLITLIYIFPYVIIIMGTILLLGFLIWLNSGG
jgi:hypothetical protein